MKSALFILASALSLSLVEATADHAENFALPAARVHRRHHKKRGTCKPKSTAPASTSNSTLSASVSIGTTEGVQSSYSSSNSSAVSAAASVSSSNNSSSSSSSSSSGSNGSGSGMSGFIKNGIYIGFLPDDGSGQGGQRETIQTINSKMGGKSAVGGYYAQAQSGTLFDGGQLLARFDEVVASGAVFQPAVMPTGGWWGLTASNNQQAVAICKVMKKFTDAGVETWLRFAHEVNWYQQDGTYQGGVSDFKAGWAAVASACKQIAPAVKLFFTPNVASLSNYDQYYPDDPSTVDYIGIDYYPTGPGNFVSTMKPFHDKYCNENTKFAIGEIGLNNAANLNTRVQFLQEMTSASTASQMPHYVATAWFNYFKDYQFKIANVQGDSQTAAYLA